MLEEIGCVFAHELIFRSIVKGQFRTLLIMQKEYWKQRYTVDG
jgi:hypothetical protein